MTPTVSCPGMRGNYVNVSGTQAKNNVQANLCQELAFMDMQLYIDQRYEVYQARRCLTSVPHTPQALTLSCWVCQSPTRMFKIRG